MKKYTVKLDQWELDFIKRLAQEAHTEMCIAINNKKEHQFYADVVNILSEIKDRCNE